MSLLIPEHVFPYEEDMPVQILTHTSTPVIVHLEQSEVLGFLVKSFDQMKGPITQAITRLEMGGKPESVCNPVEDSVECVIKLSSYHTDRMELRAFMMDAQGNDYGMVIDSKNPIMVDIIFVALVDMLEYPFLYSKHFGGYGALKAKVIESDLV